MPRSPLRHLAFAVPAAVAVALTATGSVALAAPVPTSPSAVSTLVDAGVRLAPTEAPTPRTATMSVEGAGPYLLGTHLRVLSGAGLLDWIVRRPGAGNVVDAGATGAWAGDILLTFRDSKLVEIGTATSTVESPTGATVGMSFKDVAHRYGERGELIANKAGEQAFVVRHGDMVELFTGHPIRSGVGYFQVGRADFTEQAFLAR